MFRREWKCKLFSKIYEKLSFQYFTSHNRFAFQLFQDQEKLQVSAVHLVGPVCLIELSKNESWDVWIDFSKDRNPDWSQVQDNNRSKT